MLFEDRLIIIAHGVVSWPNETDRDLYRTTARGGATSYSSPKVLVNFYRYVNTERR